MVCTCYVAYLDILHSDEPTVEIRYCPRHDAADAMYEAFQLISKVLHTHPDDWDEGAWEFAMDEVDAAIALADGEKDGG